MADNFGRETKNDSSPLCKMVNKIFEVIASVTTASIFTVVIIQIVGRLIGSPAPWTEEATRFIFIWMIFLGVGLGFREAESARVTLVVDRLPNVFRKFSIWVYAVGTIGFFLFLLWSGIGLMQQQMTMNETSAVLLIPMWLIGISVPIGAVLGIFNTIQSLVYHRNKLV